MQQLVEIFLLVRLSAGYTCVVSAITNISINRLICHQIQEYHANIGHMRECSCVGALQMKTVLLLTHFQAKTYFGLCTDLL
jgi:hypothetical protein